MPEQRLIDANKLKESVPETHVDIFENCRNCRLLDKYQVRDLIDDAPTVDAVEVVRCKDCAVPHNYSTGCPKLGGLIPSEDFYCACGKRKDGETDGK